MAKKRARKMHEVDLPVGAEPEFVATPPEPEPEPKTVTHTVTTTVLSCSIPYFDGPTGYCARRIDMMLTGNQAEKLKGILVGIQEQEGELANGQVVRTPGHALQYMIENAS